MKNIVKFLFIILLLVTQCKELDDTFCMPRLSFTGKFPKRNIDLTKQLGQTFYTLKQSNKNKIIIDSLNSKHDTIVQSVLIADTCKYEVVYDKTTKLNTVIKGSNGDTIFIGYASKYKGYIYLSKELIDGTFWIAAMKLDVDSVQGLFKFRDQMCRLQDTIRSDSLSPLVVSHDSTGYMHLRTNKKLVHDIYPLIVAGCEQYKLVIPQWEHKEYINYNEYKELKEEVGKAEHENKIMESVFPNPAYKNVQIELASIDEYRINIVDNMGKTIKSQNVTTSFVEISLEGLSSGSYHLQLIKANGDIIEQNNLLVR